MINPMKGTLLNYILGKTKYSTNPNKQTNKQKIWYMSLTV